MEKRFYVNVGVAFNALCKLIGVPVLEKPKEYECESCGIQARLENCSPAQEVLDCSRRTGNLPPW